MADVEIGHVFAVVEFLDDLVDLGKFAALGGEILAAGEDAEEEDFGLGGAFLDFFDDGGDAFDDLAGGVVFAVGIVGADHDDGDFGFDAFEVSVLQAPEDVLGAVTTDAEVHGFAIGVMFFPDFFGSAAFPALGDGVADENELGVLGVFDAGVEEVGADFPAGVAGHWGDGGVIGKGGSGGKNDGE